MFSIGQPNEPKIRYCCWNSCIRFMVAETPEVEPQVTRRPPRLRQSSEPFQVSAPDMLEHHVDALALGQPADLALEALGAVVDDVVGAERLRLLALLVVADRRVDRAADGLRHLDRRRADAGSARMDEDRFARLQLRVVEQHVLHGAEPDRRAGRLLERDARSAPG